MRYQESCQVYTSAKSVTHQESQTDWRPGTPCLKHVRHNHHAWCHQTGSHHHTWHFLVTSTHSVINSTARLEWAAHDLEHHMQKRRTGEKSDAVSEKCGHETHPQIHECLLRVDDEDDAPPKDDEGTERRIGNPPFWWPEDPFLWFWMSLLHFPMGFRVDEDEEDDLLSGWE